MKIRTGIIGCGHLGKLHLKMHKMLDNSEIIGVYDSNPEAATKAALEYQVTAYADLGQLIDSCQALIIVTTTSAHHAVAKKCLLKNKHIFIEKPITVTVAEAEELVFLAKERNLKIQVGHIERYNPAFQAVKDIPLQPKFIEVHRLANFNPRGTDVAVVLDLMIHDIDIVLNLIKSPVVQIDASGVCVVTDNIDIANVRLKFANGAVANITTSRISLKKMRKFRIFQKDTYINLDFDLGSADIFRLTDLADDSLEGMAVGQIEKSGKKIIYTNRPKVECNALLEENRDFLNCIINNTLVSVSAEDGLEALKIASEIIRKINTELMNNSI